MEPTLPIAEFGFLGPLRDRLVAAILRGEKTSTTGLHEEYVRTGEEPAPVGQRELVVDSDGNPVAVIETTSVEVRRFGDVDLVFAIDEGECFASVADWQVTHRRFFESAEMQTLLGEPRVTIDDDTLVVCHRFRLIEKLERADPGAP